MVTIDKQYHSEVAEKTAKIALCIATYKRPDSLERLLRSLSRQSIPNLTDVELRIVDNDTVRSSESVFTDFAEGPHPFASAIYIHESTQNIALARNAAIDRGPADFYVFIDDDEIAGKKWLESLVQSAVEYQADAVFGPVYGVFENNVPKWIAKGGFFNKAVPERGTRIDWKHTRTSNTLVRGSYFYGTNPIRFEAAFGRSGGSDSAIFANLQNAGAKFISCPEALVWETVPARRSNLKWLLKRWYRNGLIYERITSEKIKDISPLHRFLRRVAGTQLLLVKGLFSRGPSRLELLAKASLKAALAVGGAVAWMRPSSAQKHVAYDSKPTAKTSPKRRVAFLTNIVSPYRAPVFKMLGQDRSIELKVFIDAETEFDRNWSVDTSELDISKPFSLSWKRSVRFSKPFRFTQKVALHLPVGLIFSLLKYRPEAIISHELGFRSIIAALYCRLFRKPLLIWAYQSRVSSGQASWRQRIRKSLLQQAEVVLGMGTQAREVLRNWGVPDEKIVDALNAANHISIDRQLSSPSAHTKIRSIKEKYSKGGRRLAIVVGRLIPLKGIECLLDAWDQLRPEVKDRWSLLFVGDGPLAEYIQERDPLVHHAESVDHDSIAYWFSAADLHLFPSIGDVWGLVVNEASHCGTPTICSPYAGCADDLVIDGETGLIIDFTDTPEAVARLEKALTFKSYIGMGNAARERVERFSLANLSNSFAEAVNRVV